MIIHDLNIPSIAVAPNKTDSPLVINADAVLTLAVPVKRLQTVAWRGSQISQFHNAVELAQLSLSIALDGAERSAAFSTVKELRILAAKRFDHLNIV